MKQKIEAVLLPLLTAVLGFVLSPFFRGLWDWFADVGLPALTKTQKLSLVAGLSILCLVLACSLCVIFSKKLLLKRFEPTQNWIGAYSMIKDKRQNEIFCGPCLHQGKTIPLVTSGSSYTECGLCHTKFVRAKNGATL